MRKLLFATLVLLLCACHSKNDKLTGSWVQPIPGQSGKMQGMELKSDGTASSINMHTLVYESWSRKGDNLILKGKSIGNRQTIDFADTLIIEKLTADSLVFSWQEMKMRFSRQN